MNKKAATIDLKGNPYAKVAERVKLFREDTVRGDIQTKQIFNQDGTMTFKTTIIADRADDSSKRGTGHATKKITSDKESEKLETISVGRALANMGYLPTGEIACFEEMEDFHKDQEDKRAGAIENLRGAKTLDELKEIYFHKIGNLASDKEVTAVKDEVKIKLTGGKDAVK